MSSFYDVGNTLAPEAIAGIGREHDIILLGGDYGKGKSPVLADIAVCTINGLDWCGRRTMHRPVIALDFESSAHMYKRNIRESARRRGVLPPRVPEELDAYLANDDASTKPTARLLHYLSLPLKKRINLLKEALTAKPNALVLIDPIDMLFQGTDKVKSNHVVWEYGQLKETLAEFPKALYMVTRNLRKTDRKTDNPDLLNNPRSWLEEIAGSKDILNRCDVRIGIDTYRPNAHLELKDEETDIRVLNGIRRGESFEPMLIQPAPAKEADGRVIHDHEQKVVLAGFELVDASTALSAVLTESQLNHWPNIPFPCRFEDVADKGVPRSTLWRILQRAKGIGVVLCEKGVWKKCGPALA